MPKHNYWQAGKRILTPGRIAAVFGATTGCLGCYLVWRHISTVGDRFTIRSHVFELEKGRYPYIYLPPNINRSVASLTESTTNPTFGPEHDKRGIWFPWIQQFSHDPWTLLRLAKSADHNVRLLGVQALSERHGWNDAHYRQLAQALDRRTLIALARCAGADPRFFLRPPELPKKHMSTEDEFRALISALKSSDLDACTQYFTTNALQEGRHGIAYERGGLWWYGDSGLSYTHSLTSIPHEKIVMYCIEALLKHSMIESHCRDIVRLGGLQLLQRYKAQHPGSPNLLQHVARIIRNLALHSDLHPFIVDSGWVGILAEWIKSDDIGLSSTAASALGNLDQDFGPQIYMDQVYLCHPQFRFSEPIYADVVFIHGLLGGAFRTWRQKDRKVSKTGDVKKSPDVPLIQNKGPVSTLDLTKPQLPAVSIIDNKDKYTFCWPKAWLAEDCPNVRILLVDYDTYLSDWSAKCPYESEKRTLAVRSKDMLKRLQAAGIGNRPVIWVGHSMGGLLIKRMLTDAEREEDYKKIFSNTKGVVLYSTPHRGTHLAAYSTHAKFLLNPSVEVKELKLNSPMLLELHDSFRRLIESRKIPVLSFGELEKSYIMNMRMLVVPPESSEPGFGHYHKLMLNHLDICKPIDRHCNLYQLTRAFIIDCIPANRVSNLIGANVGTDTIMPDYLS